MSEDTSRTETVESLREQRDALLLRHEIDSLTRSLPTPDLGRRVVEAWGDVVDRDQWRWDTPGYAGADMRQTSPSDRADGDNPPHWETEHELHFPRGLARWLRQTDETVIGATTALQSYILGDGGSVTFAERGRRESATDLSRAAEAVWRSFADRYWSLGQRIEAMTDRWRIDGELALWVRPSDDPRDGVACLSTIEPEWITEPDRPETLEEHYGLPACNWKYGIARTDDIAERTVGLFAQRYGSVGDWEFVPDRELIWAKRNTVARVKRGVSDLFPTATNIQRAAKLLGNTAQGAALQAAIAYIRDHGERTSSTGVQAAAAAGFDGSFTRPTQRGGQTVQTRKMLPGTIVDTNGGKYVAGPVGAGQGAGFLAIVQGVLRIVGVRWNMPEFMISGDASNNNYASALVAESPFTKACQTDQQRWIDDVETPLVWAVLDVACRRGVFAPHGIDSVRQLRRALEVTVSLPEVEVRDKTAETARRKTLVELGVLSVPTVAEEEGYDHSDEVERGARPLAVAGIGLGGAPPSGAPLPSLPTPAGAATGSVEGGDVSVVGGEVVKPAETALNGAQIQAALTIVQSVAGGTLPRDAAKGQLVTLFNLSPQEADGILGSAGRGFSIAPSQIAEAVEATLREAWRAYP